MVSRFQNQQVCVSMLKFDRWIGIEEYQKKRSHVSGIPDYNALVHLEKAEGRL
ncbi:hypothetical protein MiSe_94520 [Microseira wollei NIES-4236]|uniref:Uncharacterized protein n=1 Tax=Microseira wollei NIES-4236 TaxID=2530354 RepID=A0AAV3XTH9_9CYAN|nr:hypothetical protein MiSe_94520 [Microseira wollei NIES-4236]